MNYYDYLKHLLQLEAMSEDWAYWAGLFRDAPPELDELGNPMDTPYQRARAIIYSLRKRGQQAPCPEHKPREFALLCEMVYQLAENISHADRQDLFNLYLDAVNADLVFADDASPIRAFIVLSRNEPEIWIDTVACQIAAIWKGVEIRFPMSQDARQRLFNVIEESNTI